MTQAGTAGKRGGCVFLRIRIRLLFPSRIAEQFFKAFYCAPQPRSNQLFDLALVCPCFRARYGVTSVGQRDVVAWDGRPRPLLGYEPHQDARIARTSSLGAAEMQARRRIQKHRWRSPQRVVRNPVSALFNEIELGFERLDHSVGFFPDGHIGAPSVEDRKLW